MFISTLPAESCVRGMTGCDPGFVLAVTSGAKLLGFLWGWCSKTVTGWIVMALVQACTCFSYLRLVRRGVALVLRFKSLEGRYWTAGLLQDCRAGCAATGGFYIRLQNIES